MDPDRAEIEARLASLALRVGAQHRQEPGQPAARRVTDASRRSDDEAATLARLISLEARLRALGGHPT